MVPLDVERKTSAEVVPVLRTGFRPFFFLAALWAAVALPLWAMALQGRLSTPAITSVWHGHEMLSGFAFAVVAGFLLTAVRNWTSRETARGIGLAVLASLWILARVAALAGDVGIAEGVVEIALFLGVLGAILRPIVKSRNLRNAPFLVVLALWSVLDGLVHFAPARASWALARELDLVVFLMVVITGRVVPGFTQNAIPDLEVVRSPRIDRAAIALAVATFLAGILPVPPTVGGALAILAGVAVLVRARGWGFARTLRSPILWVLHLGHAWLGVGLVLRGLPVFVPSIPPTLGLHALTAGAIGTLTLAMMTRVALGHTGRQLRAPPFAVIGYGLVTAAAVLRAIAAIAPSVLLWTLAATVFSAAFAAFLVAYTGILFGPRADGARE
jgi:uncharacterized protein involved in response to NO